jgi:hypothetical protein
MRLQHRDVNVRISRRTLWVGLQAYPLHNVTRVRPMEVKLNYRAVALGYGRKASAWAGLGVVGLTVLACLGEAAPIGVSVVFAVVILGMLTLHTVRLIRRLTMPKLYALSVATTGDVRAALVSTDKDQIYELTNRVVDAIDNPALEYAIKIDNIETIFGDKVGGDKVGGDKIDGDKIVADGWG